jgi:hypothetical protein
MTEAEQNEKSHMLAREWFKEHRASLVTHVVLNPANGEGDSLLIIDWRRPDTGNYAMRFTINRNYVIVTGDVGDAIYGFGAFINLEKLASFDWHYFIHKCVASETGRDYTMKIPGIKHAVPNVRAIGRYVGLQMAIKQLYENKI